MEQTVEERRYALWHAPEHKPFRQIEHERASAVGLLGPPGDLDVHLMRDGGWAAWVSGMDLARVIARRRSDLPLAPGEPHYRKIT